MKIEVVLIDSINGDNLTSLKNYDENKNLFEINKFEAKKNIRFFSASNLFISNKFLFSS